jgi:hypothetical protein
VLLGLPIERAALVNGTAMMFFPVVPGIVGVGEQRYDGGEAADAEHKSEASTTDHSWFPLSGP